MATQDRTRHDRLRGLLPRAYATDPQSSALGTMLEVLAEGLASSDLAIETALRDRWLATSAGPRPALEAVAPPGWLRDERVPAIQRAAARADGERLALRVARLLAPDPGRTLRSPLETARVLVGERLLAPRAEDFADEASALTRLQQLLAPLGLNPLAQAPVELEFTLEGEAPQPDALDLRIRRLWARWLLPGEALEALLAPAGAVTALVLLRGPLDDGPYRAAFDQLRADLRGLTPVRTPGLPTLSMARPPQPLELLGAALDLRRQAWETDVEAYRTRVRILGPMLTRGLATPRVMLAATLTSLASEPCPVLERPEPDSTHGFGLPPGTLARCPLCQGGRLVPPPGSVCPMRERASMEATVTDNPRTRAKLVRSRLAPSDGAATADGRIRVRNDSLFSARPTLELRVPGPGEVPADTRVVPSLRSSTTGEEMVVPAVLGPGDRLVIRPASDYDSSLPRHKQVWVDPPAGEALLPARAEIHREGGSLELVDVVLFADGPRFDQARFSSVGDQAYFDEGHWDQSYWDENQVPDQANKSTFAATSQAKTTPELRPGDNDWRYVALSKAQVASLVSDYGLEVDDLELDGAVDFPSATTKVALELRWWTRPPARFRVRVQLGPAVLRALEAGAASYLRRMIERVRPAGVHPILDFALEPFIEDGVRPEVRADQLALSERIDADPQSLLEIGQTQPEPVDPGEQVGFIGIFNVTLYDISLFAEDGIVPGVFDQSEFETSLFVALDPSETGLFDEEYWDFSVFADPPDDD